jgi:hypothetical protein
MADGGGAVVLVTGQAEVDSLAFYEAACAAIKAAATADAAKGITDQAEAVRVYARQAGNRDLELNASEIRIRAERRLGEIILEKKANGILHNGARPFKPVSLSLRKQKSKSKNFYVCGHINGKPFEESTRTDDRALAELYRERRQAELRAANPVRTTTRDDRLTLTDIGIRSNLAARAQTIARPPLEDFEHQLQAWRSRNSRLRELPSFPLIARQSQERSPRAQRRAMGLLTLDGFSISRLAFGELKARAIASQEEAAFLLAILTQAVPPSSACAVGDVYSDDELRRLRASISVTADA